MRASHTLPLALLLVACGGSQSTPAGPSGPDTPSGPTTPDTPDTPDVPSGPPVARTVDVVDERFGLEVADPYRWMEGNDNAERDDWMRGQGAYAAAWFDRIPERDALLKRIRELGLDSSASGGLQLAGGRTFFLHTAAGASLPVLKVREQDGSERVLVDPSTIQGEGGHASLNAYAASYDGKHLAYDLSTGGSEVSSIRVLDVATGEDLPDVVPMIWGEFPASWLPDGKGFFYTQMVDPGPGGDPIQNMKVRLHVLGTPVEDDVDILVADRSASLKIAPEEFPFVVVPEGSRHAIALGLGARSEVRVAIAKLSSIDRSGKAATKWTKVAGYEDQVERPDIYDGRLYLQTFAKAPNRKLVSVPVEKPSLAKARVEIAEDPQAPLTGFAIARDGLYALRMSSGQATLLRKPWKAKKAAAVTLPYPGAIGALVADVDDNGVTYPLVAWTSPSAWYRYDPTTKASEPTGLGTTTVADFTGIVAEEAEAVSADGTKVPISILRRADLALDGTHPAYVVGYGGYGISLDPSFDATRLAWLERGGVWAVCHVRGGGEKGFQWQQGGVRDKKMNGVHDLIGCGEHLIAGGYTRGDKLAVQGGSMGGILVGRAITERPDVFAAANIQVGMVNPLRMLHADNGANQKAELGDPETEAGYRQIHAMDPYVHVVDGTAYPAVVFTVGLNDKRVAPWMTAKMAARMQAATSSGKPVLLRIDSDAGHGVGSTRDQVYAEKADVWSFFLSVAGEPGFADPG